MPAKIDVPGSRSPRYPRISLIEAVEHTKSLYSGAHRSAIDTNTAFRLMGFAGKSGASATVLGALRQYGLVEGLRGDVRVGELALRILEPSSGEEYVEAMHEAGNKPEIFDALHRHFGEALPHSDEVIRSYLIRSLGFTPPGAEECIRSVRRTLEQLDSIPIVSSEPTNLLPVPVPSTDDVPTDRPTPDQNVPEEVYTKFARIPLTQECDVELRFTGPVTPAAVERLLRYIDVMKEVWSEG